MILPIRAYGDPVLRKETESITAEYPNLNDLIDNMFETMDASNGVGLAAPQIGRAIRLFVIDSTHMYEKEGEGERMEFINPVIEEEVGDEWSFEEGCLSIPHIREDVNRKPVVTMTYQDREFNTHKRKFDGMTARVIQHEYDHIEGVLFIDHISAFKRQLIKNKLNAITKGRVKVDYRMRFPKK
jgi:peptide deformylase